MRSESWILTKEFRFEASHQLMHHDGKCARLHGHSWKGRVYVKGGVLQTKGPKHNMLIDYADISAPIKEMVEKHLDHYHLNDTLSTDSPTSEFIAKWIYDHLVEKISGLDGVSIDETCTSQCTYIPKRR